MPTPVIVGAARTAIGRSFKGTLVNTPPEALITTVLPRWSAVGHRPGRDRRPHLRRIALRRRRSGALCGRRDRNGERPGQSVNRHCAGSLTAIGNAAAQIGSGMERALIAGGVQSLSMTPLTNWRIPVPS